jgi:hypothetical protein
MKKILTFHSKDIDIQLSAAAEKQSKSLASTLVIEIQIYFSCLLGKRLAFYSYDNIDNTYPLDKETFTEILSDSQTVTENINLRFNTVMTKSCSVSEQTGPPPVTDFKIANQRPYVPNWLTIDYENGIWSGKYGWDKGNKKISNIKQISALSTS